MLLGVRVFRYIVLCIMASLLLSCAKDSKDVIDQTLKMSRDDYKSQLLPPQKPVETVTLKAPSIPDVSPILVAPRRPLIGKDKLVSLSVTEDVPLKDVLLELSRLSDIDMELDPAISGGIILKVKNRPFSEVIERIANLAGLRYSLENGAMKVEKDTPYLATYPVDFLNLIRSNKSDIAVSTTVGNGGAAGGTSGSGTGSGSSNAITSQYDGDLWKSLEDNINKMIGSSSTATAAAAPAAATPTAAATATPSSTPSSSAVSGGVLSTLGLAGQTASPASLTTLATTAANMASSTASAAKSSFVTINKQAGVINVFGTKKQQDSVKKYLDYVKESTSSQVLIDAKIVEVTLNDEYHTGINWNTVDRNLGVGIKGDFTTNITGITDKIGIGVLNKTATSLADPTNLEAMVNMTQIFGTTRTLSSPRLHAMNNQQALLSFAENDVYFSLDIETTDAQVTNGTITQPAKTTVNSTLNTVPIGIILSLQPSINVDSNEITMSIRPTLSRITGHVEDPAVAYIAASSTSADVRALKNTVPIVEVREMDSVLKIKNGQIMVIGGLMEERANNNDSGVPFLGTIPWAGNLFKSVGKTTSVVQTVIFIKATIIPSSGGVGHEDKDFYKKFTRDPKPLAF